jgi:hypothetical protein
MEEGQEPDEPDANSSPQKMLGGAIVEPEAGTKTR